MSHLKAYKILLGITGSIAAYKAAFLTRLFIKSGAEVRIVMTPSATEFITPITLSTLSQHPVHYNIQDAGSWNNHVELGLWADVMIIAPASANTIAKMANGICDNILLASYLSAKCPVFVAPAMDLDMWKHFSTKNNIATLQKGGNKIIPVGHGELASGLVGAGRMAEPEEILTYIQKYLTSTQDLKGKTALVTAGPTHEALDPVRFIGNRSTGKMGIAIAEELADRGAKVVLILGPSSLSTSHENINTLSVTSAEEMYQAAIAHFPTSNIAVLAAAVADYRPANFSDKKIKKKEGDMSIALARTKDIAAELGRIKSDNQITIGFALETNDEKNNAHKKLDKKNFDFIVLNSLQDKGAGFQHDTNKISIIRRDAPPVDYPLKSKVEVAKDIVNELVNIL